MSREGGAGRTAAGILAEYESLKEKPLNQFILLADYLNKYTEESCRFRVDSLDPLEINFFYHFKDKPLLVALCVAKLETQKKAYELDDINTLFVEIRDFQTLEIIKEILHRILDSENG